MIDFSSLYAAFEAPISAFDCGDKCAPYNQHGVPFCCDTRHALPSVYDAEWDYLQAHTGLWHLWQGDGSAVERELRAELPEGQVLVECLGASLCQRGFRALTCRAFPFFPYLDLQGRFLGLSYYWEFEDRCWVISNLQLVSPEYRGQFIAAFEVLFERLPEERETFRQQSIRMRQAFGRRRRAIPLLHRDGGAYKVSPRSGRLRRVPPERLPRFGPYQIAARLPFPNELAPLQPST